MLKKYFFIISIFIIGVVFNTKSVLAKTYQDANIEFAYPDWAENSYGKSSLPDSLKDSVRVAVKSDTCSFQVFEGHINDNSKFRETTEKNISDQVKTLNGEITYQNIQDKTFEIQIIFKVASENSTLESSYTEYAYGVLADNGNIYNINYTAKSSDFENGCKNNALETINSIKIKNINNIEQITDDIKKQVDNIINHPLKLTWEDFKNSIKLAFTFNQEKKSALELKFAEEKVKIINALSKSGYNNVQDIIDKLTEKIGEYVKGVNKIINNKTTTEEQKNDLKEKVEIIENSITK